MMDELRELYQEVILDHGKHPRNLRKLPDANRHAHGNNPLCGDRVTVYMKIGRDGLIEDVSFEGRGCAISTASASMMTEILKGRTEAEAHRLFEHFHAMCTGDETAFAPREDEDPDAFERLLMLSGVRQFPMRVKCATLAWHTMNAAMAGETKVSTE
jgi:nitrogen fixation NifU-like protein